MSVALAAAVLWTAQLGAVPVDVHDAPVELTQTPPREALSADRFLLLAYRASGSWTWARQALAVARCESQLQPDPGRGAAGEIGIMQIHPVHRPWLEELGYPWSSLLHAGTNLRVAWLLQQRDGWGAWSCPIRG